MNDSVSSLQSEIAKLVQARLPDGVSSIEVEPAVSEDGEEYWLVTVGLQRHDFDDDALEALLEEIESSVARVDDRYPSVRFQDAA